MRYLMLTATMLLAVTMHAQSIDTRRTVSTQGVAETRMKPDRASITLGVETEGKNAAVVKRDNDDAMREIFAALAAAGVAHEYIELGSYFSQWRLRNALKMWTGWPTFPMVFVRGTLVGGADDLRRLINSGELQALLKA